MCASSYENSSYSTTGLVSENHKRSRPAGKYAGTGASLQCLEPSIERHAFDAARANCG